MSDTQQQYLPKWIAWETTRRCNLQCIHCRCSSDPDAPDGDFNTAEAFRLIDDICSVSRPVLVLSGGEPLLRDDIFEIAAYGTEQGLRMCMATNGTLVTDEICRKMKSVGIRMVSLSLDGASAAVHDDFRRCVGAFDATVRAAATLRRNGLPFLINSSFTRRNQADIAATFQLAKKLGAVAWYLFMIVPTGRGEELLKELISGADYEEILAWHYRQERDERDILMRPTCAPHYYRIAPQMARQEGRRLERRSLSFSTGGGKGCLAGQSICFIDAFGDLKPCSYFPRTVGNVKRSSFGKLWFDSPLLKELRNFDRYGGKCGVCEYLRVCGGCRARADAVHGDYLAEEPFCSYQPAKSAAAKDD
ncbi:MAG: AdoMet-dependent heme synthase [Desulfuromonadales bacterium]|jgi:heme b synthase|nr:AdoMet-dependent heme synthase [Desulfuromonadales bacterium]